MYHLGLHGSSMRSSVPLCPPAFGSVILRVIFILKVTWYLKKSYCSFTYPGCTPERGRQKKSLPVRLLGRISAVRFLIPIYIPLTATSTREAGKVSRVLVWFILTLHWVRCLLQQSRSFDWEGVAAWRSSRQLVVSVTVTYLFKILRSLDSETWQRLLWYYKVPFVNLALVI